MCVSENWDSGSTTTVVKTSTVNIIFKCLSVYLLNDRSIMLKVGTLVMLKVILAAIIAAGVGDKGSGIVLPVGYFTPCLALPRCHLCAPLSSELPEVDVP